jgi:phosphoribosyl 1,2-cyclic phosphodiesterase
VRIASLGSGSGGNATLVDTGDGIIMIDCGFSAAEVERRLERLSCSLEDIAAILVTHEHSDHLGGVGSISRKKNLPVYLTHGTAQRLADRHRATAQIIHADQPFELHGVSIHPVPVPHDAREPVQFVFNKAGFKLGVLTDLGSLTAHIMELYRGCQMLLVEANHDLEMLMNGPYPVSLKKRVGGRWGHLNNQQTAEFVQLVNGDSNLQTLVIGHISKQNNHLDRVKACLLPVTAGIDQIHYALQDSPLDWVSCEVHQEKKSA